MYHLSSLHLYISQCSICAKSVIKTLMISYFALNEIDGWNGLCVALNHGVTTGDQPASKLSQNCITSQNI